MIQKTKEWTRVSDLSARLYDLILAMSEEQQFDLLQKLGQKGRKFPRKHYITAVECEASDFLGRTYMHNISAGGMLMQTTHPFVIGQRVNLNFSFKNMVTFRLKGDVVRKTSIGVGIAFVEVSKKQEEMLESFIATMYM
jgi:Tfp pilus assembly protein PilZ